MTSYSNYDKFMHNKQQTLQQTYPCIHKQRHKKIPFTIDKQCA